VGNTCADKFFSEDVAMLKLLNGMDKVIKFNKETIKSEASQDGMTSFVKAICENGKEVVISQHSSGDWDISVNGDHYNSYDEEESDDAVDEFIRLIDG
jgi:hypothetical protein